MTLLNRLFDYNSRKVLDTIHEQLIRERNDAIRERDKAIRERDDARAERDAARLVIASLRDVAGKLEADNERLRALTIQPGITMNTKHLTLDEYLIAFDRFKSLLTTDQKLKLKFNPNYEFTLAALFTTALQAVDLWQPKENR